MIPRATSTPNAAVAWAKVWSTVPSLARTREIEPAVLFATQRSAPSDATSKGLIPTVVLELNTGILDGVTHCPNAARLLPRRNAESCVLVTKAAIWSLSTTFEGLYVVAEVPLVRPEKYASAIEQKKILPITSVNGTVVIVPPHVLVSAGRRLDASNKTMIVKNRITAE
jgi:hypothetical protein